MQLNATSTYKSRTNDTHHWHHLLGSRICSQELRSGTDQRLSTRPVHSVDRPTDYCESSDTTWDHGRTATPLYSASTPTAPWQCPPGTDDLMDKSKQLLMMHDVRKLHENYSCHLQNANWPKSTMTLHTSEIFYTHSLISLLQIY